MEIKKNTLVLIKEPLGPPESRFCLVTSSPSDSDHVKVVDLDGHRNEFLRKELIHLAEVKISTRSAKKALGSCYQEVTMNLIRTLSSIDS